MEPDTGDQGLDRLLDDLESALDAVDALPESVRADVLLLLDGVDALHRAALLRLGELIGPPGVDRLRHDSLVAWLFDAYGVGVDQKAAAEAALDEVRPYIHSHGGSVDLLRAAGGVVRIRLSGACSGCTASAETLRGRIEEELRERVPGFVGVEAEEDEGASPHPPPVGPVPVELSARPGPPRGSPQP